MRNLQTISNGTRTPWQQRDRPLSTTAFSAFALNKRVALFSPISADERDKYLKPLQERRRAERLEQLQAARHTYMEKPGDFGMSIEAPRFWPKEAQALIRSRSSPVCAQTKRLRSVPRQPLPTSCTTLARRSCRVRWPAWLVV